MTEDAPFERRQGERRAEERERIRLFEQLIAAEQDERRRLALFLHDGAVQSLSGIALMLDAVGHAIAEGRLEDAKEVLASALERHRETIQSLRALSFNLEPVVLRDQGFGPAVRALAEQLGLSEKIQIELEIGGAEGLAERAQVVLYQIIREALAQAVRRGPLSRISIRISDTPKGEVETTIEDDAAAERRRASIEAFEERARPLNGRVRVKRGPGGGTLIRVVLPAYAARG